MSFTEIAIDDVNRIIRLLGEVAGMTEPIDQRRRMLILGLAEMVDGDLWAWVHARRTPDSDVAAFSMLDGGWVDEGERGRLYVAAHDPLGIQIMSRIVPTDMHITAISRDWLSSATEHELAHIQQLYATAGLSSSVFSYYPLADNVMSAIGLHRRAGKPQYSDRERFLVHLVLSQIEWLHRIDINIAANNDVLFDLSPRQRQVLLMLLNADAPKQIAASLGMSIHTVRDHIKAIYRRFNVSDRPELFSLFVAGGRRK